MSYNNIFPYDIFISYAHVDNLAEKGMTIPGWVTQFYNELSLLIDKNVGKTGVVSIWWDDHLRKNERFDTVIENAIRDSAIFLSLTSNGYYRSDYCLKELDCFYGHVNRDKNGLFVKNQCRLFNIQQYKFDHEKWPVHFKGIGSYDFFELLNDSDKLGYPLDHNSANFKNCIKLLARDIYDLLNDMRETIDQQPATVINPSVFIGKVADTMYKTKLQVTRELEHLNINVIKGDIPPPYPRSEHRKAVMDKIAKADLSIHFMDEVPGSEIETEGPTYIQEQIEIVKEKKIPQLIFIPKQLHLEEIDNLRQQVFLNNLQENKSEKDNYSIIKELSVPSILIEIQEKIRPTRFIPEKNTEHSVFLDFHEVDTKLAIEMSTFFFKQRVNTFMCMNATSPSDTIQSFEATLKEVGSVMIILGHVTKDWVRERLNKAIEFILREECPVSKLGIYVAPQVPFDGLQIKQRFLQVQFLDDSRNRVFNPDTIMPFLIN